MYTNNNVAREDITNLLSDDEIAQLRMVQPRWLAEGEEYVDLEHLDNGVLKVSSDAPPRLGNIVPRGMVTERTWSAILGRLGGTTRVLSVP